MALPNTLRALFTRLLSSLWLCVLVAVTLAPVSAFAGPISGKQTPHSEGEALEQVGEDEKEKEKGAVCS